MRTSAPFRCRRAPGSGKLGSIFYVSCEVIPRCIFDGRLFKDPGAEIPDDPTWRETTGREVAETPLRMRLPLGKYLRASLLADVLPIPELTTEINRLRDPDDPTFGEFADWIVARAIDRRQPSNDT